MWNLDKIETFERIAHPALLENRCGSLVVSSSVYPFVISLQSESTPEENQRTWRIFRETLEQLIGREKYQEICNRYQDNYCFLSLEAEGNPLLPKHVEIFGIGMGRVFSSDIKRFVSKKLKELTRQEIQAQIKKIQPIGLIGSCINPKCVFGTPSHWSAYFFYNRILMDKERRILLADVDKLTFPSWLERFSKATINRELEKGLLIPAPGRDGNVDYYRVYRKITAGQGLIAYALKPCAKDTGLKPLIVFRPSQLALGSEDVLETYINDVEPNLGKMGWESTISQFDELMQDPHFLKEGEYVKTAGYSLGGAHAQYFLSRYYNQISEATFYADPAVDCKTAKAAAKAINKMPRRSKPLLIHIARTIGDLCHYIGEKHVGWGIRHPDVSIQLEEIDPMNKATSTFYLHANRIFDTDDFLCRVKCYESPMEVDSLLNNLKRGIDVVWYEKTRRAWGGIISSVIYIFSQFLRFLNYGFGLKILRTSTP